MDDLNEEVEDDSSSIRNYLASFQKEVEDIEESDSYVEQPSDDECDTKVIYGYFSDNEIDEDPHIIRIKEEPDDDEDYYDSLKIHGDTQHSVLKSKFINNNAKRKKLQLQSDGIPDDEHPTDVSTIGDTLHLDDQRALEMVAKFAEQAVAKAKNSDPNAAYQTVRIVPSDTNPGELNYVIYDISDETISDVIGNPAMYDLEHPAQFREGFVGKRSIDKLRALRLAARRSIQEHMCPFCSYSTSKKYLLSRHLKSHSDDRPHKCGVCERAFKTLSSLQNHVNTHTGTRPHSCRECESCFTTSGELVRHVRYKHTHEKPHKCSECDYASVELSKLKRHLRCHTGERPYQCPHCTYASPDTYKLKRHIRIHTGEKPYVCDVCQTRFTQSNSLRAHKLIHSGNKPVFKCEYCPTTCGRKTDLRIHMEKLHASDNPHRCRRCGKIFLDRYSYKIHVKSHDGEKCYKCDLCNYASASHRHLETHMLVHTDQKPFICDTCDMSFRQKQLLKRHVNIYHNPNYVKPEPKEKTHTCTVCHKGFRHKGNLLRHYSIHDADAVAQNDPTDQVPEEEGEEDDTENKDIKQEVVVFEVIQLPPTNSSYSTNQQSLALVNGNTVTLDGETQGYSIIEPVEGEDGEIFTLRQVQGPMENFEDDAMAQLPLKISYLNDTPDVHITKKQTKSFGSPSKLIKVSAVKNDCSSDASIFLKRSLHKEESEVENDNFDFADQDLIISSENTEYHDLMDHIEITS